MKRDNISKGKGLLVLSPILFLFFISLVYAQPWLIQNQQFTTGYEIVSPRLESIKQNTTTTFSFHIYNISNGMPIDNSSTSCFFHLFNSENPNLVNVSAIHNTQSGILNEWNVNILGTNFTDLGLYSYITSCNSTNNLGGYFSSDVLVTTLGESDVTNNLNFFITILLISFGIMAVGLTMKESAISLFGAMGLGAIGIFAFNNGIGLYHNWATDLSSIFIIGFALMICAESIRDILDI